MAATNASQIFQLELRPPIYSRPRLEFFKSSSISLCSPKDFLKSYDPVRLRCFARSAEDKEVDALVKDDIRDDDDVGEDVKSEFSSSNGSATSHRIATSSSSGDSLSLGIREPVYEVVEVKSSGFVSTRKIYRRHLLKSSGLRPRDIRSVDPSLWLTNTMPSLLVREHALLLNLGSLRAIAMEDRVLIFNYNRRKGFHRCINTPLEP